MVSNITFSCAALLHVDKGLILQVKFPIFQDLPQWPTPFGTLLYTEVCLQRYTVIPMRKKLVDI